MSLPEAPSYGKEYKYGIAVESVYGTAVTAATGVCQLHGINSVAVDRGIRQHEYPTGGSKDPLMEETITDVSGSIATITVGGTLNRNLLPFWANAHFQYVNADVYSYFDTHPLTPYSLTFLVKDPITGRDEVYSGCVCKSLTISGEKGDDDLVNFEAVLISKNAGLISQTLVGSDNWQTSGSKADVLHVADMSYQIDVGAGAASVLLNSFSFKFETADVEQLGPDGAGGYSEVGLVGRGADNTFECNLMPSTSTETAKVNMRTGGMFKLITAGALKLWATGIITAFDTGVDGLTKISVTAQMKAESASVNMAELDLS